MPLAMATDDGCIDCRTPEVYAHEKREATHVKRHLECDSCGAEWTERIKQ